MADEGISPELQARLNANATEPMKATGSRAENLALIDRYMAESKEIVERQQQEAEYKRSHPSAAPPVEATTTIAIAAQGKTAQQKEEERRKLTKEQEAILKHQEQLLGKEEAKRLRKEQEDRNARSKLRADVERGLDSGKDILHGADTRIGGIPQPGSILFPLILLLLFFFILIQVGGYSRLGWLWLVLTGNAYVQSGHSQASVGIPVAGTGEGNPEVPVSGLSSGASLNGVYGSHY